MDTRQGRTSFDAKTKHQGPTVYSVVGKTNRLLYQRETRNTIATTLCLCPRALLDSRATP